MTHSQDYKKKKVNPICLILKASRYHLQGVFRGVHKTPVLTSPHQRHWQSPGINLDEGVEVPSDPEKTNGLGIESVQTGEAH